MLKDVYNKYILEKGYKEDKNQLKLIDLLTQFSLQIEKPKTLIDKLFSKNSSLKRGCIYGEKLVEVKHWS